MYRACVNQVRLRIWANQSKIIHEKKNEKGTKQNEMLISLSKKKLYEEIVTKQNKRIHIIII